MRDKTNIQALNSPEIKTKYRNNTSNNNLLHLQERIDAEISELIQYELKLDNENSTNDPATSDDTKGIETYSLQSSTGENLNDIIAQNKGIKFEDTDSFYFTNTKSLSGKSSVFREIDIRSRLMSNQFNTELLRIYFTILFICFFYISSNIIVIIMLSKVAYFDNYVKVIKEYLQIFTDVSFFQLQFTKFFTVRLSSSDLQNDLKIFDKSTIEERAATYDKKMDVLFSRQIQKIFSKDYSKINLHSNHIDPINDWIPTLFENLVLFDFLYE